MSYNPGQNKPYVFLNNSVEQAIHDANVESVPSQSDEIPVTYNRDIVLDNVNAAGAYNNLDKTFSFQSNAIVFSDNQLITNLDEVFVAFSFRDKENNELGARGNELFYNSKVAYSSQDAVINSGSRSSQTANEICRLSCLPNKEYKLTATHLQYDLTTSYFSNYQAYLLQKNGLVFGFLL